MAKWSEMSGSARGALAAVAAVLVGFVGFEIWTSRQPAPAPAPAAQSAASDQTAATTTAPPPPAPAAPPPAAPPPAASPPAAAPAPATSAVTAPADQTAAAPAPTPAPSPPKPVTLDLVRIEPDGSATIAGQGEPGATVRLQMDGAEVASVLVGPSGKFASLFTLAPSAASRLLTVVETLADGTLMAGGPSVAISGVAAPAPAVTAPAAPAAPTVASAATPEPSAPAATADAGTTTATTTTADATTPAPAAAPDATAAAPATTATVATATAATAPAATAPTAVIVDDKGVTVAQTGNVGNVSLGAIAYDAKGGVLLAGKAQPGDVIQIYIDTVLVAAANAGADGSWQSSPEIAPGVHVLRLDELDASGKVVSRFETPMKRETLEALAEANTKSQAAPVQTAQGGTTAPAAPATTAATTTGAATASDAAATTTTPTAPAPPATAAATTDTTATTTADAGAAATSADQTTSGVKTPGLVTITVQPGFTLWRIAKEHLGKGIEYVEIFDDNKTQIKNPDLIYPGQVFLIPTKN